MRMRNWLLALMLLLCPAVAEASCPSTITDCPSPTFNIVTAASIISSGGSFTNPTITGTVAGGATYNSITLSGGTLTGTNAAAADVTATGASFSEDFADRFKNAGYDLASDFGIVCDGVTDQTANINAAITALPSGGGKLEFPFSPLGCVINGPVNVTKPVAFTGVSGANAQSWIIPGSATGTLFDVSAVWVSFDNLLFSPINPVTTKQTSGSYIKLDSGSGRFYGRRLTMQEFSTGILINYAVPTFDLRDFRAYLYSTGLSTSVAALDVQAGVLDARLIGASIIGPSPAQSLAGIRIQDSGDFVIDNADVVAMGTDLLVNPGSGQVVPSLWVSNSFFDTATHGIDLCPTSTGAIQRAKFVSTWASSHAGFGIRTCSGVSGADFVDTHIFANGGDGVDITGGSNVNFMGGECAQNAGSCASVSANISNWSITGMQIGAIAGFSANTVDGIIIASGTSDYFSITGNNFNGQTTAIVDASSGTHKNVYSNPNDPNDYSIYRDVGTGFLLFSGNQSGFSGYKFKTSNGAMTALTLANNGTATFVDGGTWSSGGINGSVIGATTPEAATVTRLSNAIIYAAAYGALCNNSHDDTSAIQAAVTAAEPLNAAVMIPYGICTVSSTITVGDGVSAIAGVGSQTQGQTFPTFWAGTTIFDTRLGGDTFAFVGKNAPIFRDFAIWESTTKTSGAGISINGYNTTLTANAVSGNSSVTVASSTGFINGDPIIVLHNDGTRYTGTVNGTPTPTSIPITPNFSGVTASSGNAVADMPAQFPRFYNLQLVGLYDGIRLDSATGEYLSGNYIRDFADDGLKKINAAWPDSGNSWYGGNLFIDQAVSGNAGVEWQAGGDAAFVGNKFFKGAYNFLLNVSYNSTASLRLEANSFEEAATCGVQATQASSGIIYNAFKVDGNEFSLSGSGTGKVFCVAAGAAQSWITKVSFQNNVAATDDATVGRNMVDILGGTQVKIASNQLDNNSAANATAIHVASGVLNAEVFMNKIVNYATKYSVGEPTASFIDSAGLASNGTGAAVAENQSDMNEALTNKASGTSFYIDNHSGDAVRFYDGTDQFGLNQDGTTHGLQFNIPGTGVLMRFLPTFSISLLAPVTGPDSGTWTSTGIVGSTLNVPSGRKGTFTCTGGGTISVANANMASTSNVIISMSAQGGTITTPPAFKTVTGGTGFSMGCGATDTSVYNYAILN